MNPYEQRETVFTVVMYIYRIHTFLSLKDIAPNYSKLAQENSVLRHTAEEQAGFRAGRSTTEQIFNLRILCEKYLQHQHDLYHVFIDFKKVFDRVWRAALWATMKKYNISANLIRVIKTSMTRPLRKSLQQQNRRLVLKNSWSPTGMSTLTHPLQHSSGKDHDRRLRRS